MQSGTSFNFLQSIPEVQNLEKTISNYLHYGTVGLIDEKVILTLLFTTNESPETVLRYLQMTKADDKQNFGQIIVNNSVVFQQYLSLLTKLQNEGVSVDAICLLLVEKDSHG
jgi:hypothetical protein